MIDIKSVFRKIKNNMKLIVTIIVLYTLLNINITLATKLHNLNIDVELLDGGDGLVTMEWDYIDDEGTEHYLPIKIRGTKITDFYVEKDGVPYETIEKWDVDESFEEKAYKAGIIYNGDRNVLCWGISEYGDSKYKVSYKVEGMVRSLTDYDMVFYKFVNNNLSEPPEKVKINIYHGQKQFSLDNTKLWAFGFEGSLALEEGHVVWNSERALYTTNYGEVFLRLEKDFLNSGYMEEKSFEHYKEKAFNRGSYSEEDSGEGGTTTGIRSNYNGLNIKYPIAIIGIFFLQIILSEIIRMRKRLGLKLKNYEGQYYREIPYGGDPEDIYYLLDNLRLGGEIYGYKNYVAYYLIKWIKEGVIVKEAYKSGLINKKERFRFKFSGQPKNASGSEKRTFHHLKEIAGKNNRLEKRTFRMSMRGRYPYLPWMFIGLNSSSRKTLERKQYLKITPGNQFTTIDKEELTEKGKELAENIIKFRNFLLDFSLLNERDSMSLSLWDDLMLYAVLLGIADEVKEEFNMLNPEYFDITELDLASIHLVSIFISTGGFYYTYGGGSFGGGSGGGTR